MTGYPIPEVFSRPWDVVIVGSGAAGLMACLELPDSLDILLLTKDSLARSSSRWAQGGIAAALRPDDSTEAHFHDTLATGGGLCEPAAVRMLVEEAPRVVERLLGLGVRFDRLNGQLSCTLEAAHSQRRVLHAADHTGRAIIEVLQARVRERPGLVQVNEAMVLQLWSDGRHCCGLQLMVAGTIGWLRARAVVLASGGGCRLFAKTTNPPLASGDGVVMAYRAGAALRDMEFVQFHPTAFMAPGAPHFLISEAVRGEGAELLCLDGSNPVETLGGQNLASRDQVSRALADRMLHCGEPHVWLDLRPVGQARLMQQFPTILRRCREWGVDPLTAPVPVAPAAHYWMGGVKTDLHTRTTLTGLHALGEVASSGVHGANRLASNSLMECLVWARQLGRVLPRTLAAAPVRTAAAPQLRDVAAIAVSPSSMAEATAIGRMIRDLCWSAAGVNRDGKRMAAASHCLWRLQQQLSERSELAWIAQSRPGDFQPVAPQAMALLRRWVEVEHLAALGQLLLAAACFRRESRGSHHRSDVPSRQPFWRCHSQQQRSQPIHTEPVGS